MATQQQKRIWGWMAFDWATQPFYTLGLTFIFGPYFAFVALEYFLGTGLDEETAKAQSQSLWSLGQTIAGLVIAFSAPFLGAWADTSGRKIPWMVFFAAIYTVTTWMLWGLTPDGSRLFMILAIFYIGFFAAESMLNFANAILPSLGTKDEVGRISGSAAALGYWGGLIALVFMLLLLAENENGVTLIGAAPLFGLDPETREGTRSVGPFIALWFVIFMVPFFLWVRDDHSAPKQKAQFGEVLSNLRDTLRAVYQRKSLFNFLLGSMFYRDALNALYAFGGVYAKLVLDWSIIQVGVFGIVGVITAAIVTYLGGRMDVRYGPKPVIRVCIYALILVCITIIGISRDGLYFIPFADGSSLPDIIFYICGATIGGAGGALYSASRSLMVRHTDPDRPTEAFGLFALSGKATAFLAPALITLGTYFTGSQQLGFAPVIVLFLIGLLLLRWVNPKGDRAE